MQKSDHEQYYRITVRGKIVIAILLFSIGFFPTTWLYSKKSIATNAPVISKTVAKTKPPTISNSTSPQKVLQTDLTNYDDNNNIAPSKKLTNNTTGFDPLKNDGKKTAYLTFDDGPSENNTPKILDILKENNIKATFFLVGSCAESNAILVKREFAEGHVVANHTYSHELNYNMPTENFINDLTKCDNVIKSILGKSYNLKLIRFPGGSWDRPGSSSRSSLSLKPFREAATKAGYHYVDWNDETGDAEHPLVSVDALMDNIIKYTGDNEHIVILMHDASAKTTSVDVLPKLISYLRSKGYSFDTLK